MPLSKWEMKVTLSVGCQPCLQPWVLFTVPEAWLGTQLSLSFNSPFQDCVITTFVKCVARLLFKAQFQEFCAGGWQPHSSRGSWKGAERWEEEYPVGIRISCPHQLTTPCSLFFPWASNLILHSSFSTLASQSSLWSVSLHWRRPHPVYPYVSSFLVELFSDHKPTNNALVTY